MPEQFGNFGETRLAAGVTSGATSLTLVSLGNLPTVAPFRAQIDVEIMLVTAGAGTTTLTVTRGQESTTAVAHNPGATVEHVLTARSLTLVDHIDVRGFGAVGDGVATAAAETAAIQAALAATGTVGDIVYVPAGNYNVNGTFTVGRSSTLGGAGTRASRLVPVAGMAVRVVHLEGSPGGEGATLDGIFIDTGGLAGVAAIQSASYQTQIKRTVVQDWLGHGVDALGTVHLSIRDCRLYELGGDGVKANPTVGVIENVASSSNGGNGFAITGGNGVLKGCSADSNTGHGFYITGGEWTLEGCYGESNTGDIIRVDGTQNFVTSIQLNGAHSIGATTLTVDALAKDLPPRTTIRFPDGTATYTSFYEFAGATAIELSVGLTTAQADNAVGTIAPEDLGYGSLPTVLIGPGNHDGTIYLHACNYAFIGGHLPIFGSITATQSARMIGEPFTTDPRQRPKAYGSRGGSYALGAALGLPGPLPSVGLASVFDPNDDFGLFPSDGVVVQDTTALRGFAVRLSAVGNYAQASFGWHMGALPVGQYVVRAHLKNTAKVASAIQLRTNIFLGGGNEQIGTFTAFTTGYEWIEMDYDHTVARKAAAGTIGLRCAVTATIDVDAIVVVPKSLVAASSGHISSGTSTTANRPSPVHVRVGSRWYDTTLSKPIWSDGTVWRDAAGTAV